MYFGNYQVPSTPPGTVVGGEVAYENLSGMLISLCGIAALVVGGGIIIGLRRKHSR
jgi:hypothetical protein